MCGIFGYVGTENGSRIVYDALKILEYRGYDNWGIAVQSGLETIVVKDAGRIPERLPLPETGRVAIGHTRWATHGGKTRQNSHPHASGDVYVVHNGMIDNYVELRGELQNKGFVFSSETDTEVVPHLIQHHLKQGNSFEGAFLSSVARLKGSNSLLAMHNGEIMFWRNGSPLVLGLGEQEYFVSSDIPSFLSRTRRGMRLEDGDYGRLTKEGVSVFRNGSQISKDVITFPSDIVAAQKGEYAHFMHKEIHEQPVSIGRALNQDNALMERVVQLMEDSDRVFIVGCGTSYNSGSIASYRFLNAGLKTTSVLGSDFLKYRQFLTGKSVVFALSQSGETKDMMDVTDVAQNSGSKVVGIVNVPTSTLAHKADVFIPMQAGIEIGVAATKTHTSQLAILYSLVDRLSAQESQLERVADQIGAMLQTQDEQAKELAYQIAPQFARRPGGFCIGFDAMSKVAREAALKIKEVAYVFMEAMPAGELKHGSIALIEPGPEVGKDEQDQPIFEPGTPVFAFANDATRAFIADAAKQVKSRGAFVIGIDSQNHPAYHVHIPVPELGDITPLASVIPAQLLAYHLAVVRDSNPDMPRNLAKAVTVR